MHNPYIKNLKKGMMIMRKKVYLIFLISVFIGSTIGVIVAYMVSSPKNVSLPIKKKNNTLFFNRKSIFSSQQKVNERMMVSCGKEWFYI